MERIDIRINARMHANALVDACVHACTSVIVKMCQFNYKKCRCKKDLVSDQIHNLAR